MGDHLPEPVSAGNSSSKVAGPGSWPTRPGPAACLYAARALRDFGDGFVAILLAVYLIELGLGPLEIGVIATAALLGSSLLTLAIGLLGRPGTLRTLLIGASALMTATGIAFAAASDYVWLLLIAFVGTINPSAGNVSIFVPMEHALLAGIAPANRRTRMFAAYGLTGAIAAAVGSLAAGSPDFLTALGWSRIDALKAMFLLYAAIGIAGGFMYRLVPASADSAESRPRFSLAESKPVVLKLAGLFSVDSFAGGLVINALLALWLFERFGISLTGAGAFFFWTGLLSAVSQLAAPALARRVGLVNTMVFTHIPASLCLIGAAFASSLELALGLLLARSLLSQMDVPARSAYVMSVVTPAERPAAASFTAVPRSLASAVGPSLAGAMFAAGLMSAPLVACGLLKIAYDLALFARFRKVATQA